MTQNRSTRRPSRPLAAETSSAGVVPPLELAETISAGQWEQAAREWRPPGTWYVNVPVKASLLLNSNQRLHWAQRARLTAHWRELAAALARQAKVPALARAHVLAAYLPPDRRRRDPANLYPTVKALVDGLVDAGVLPDDDATHLDGPDMRLGEPSKPAYFVLTITDRGACSASATTLTNAAEETS
jgi:crossover junction endodeoxyribonuclease RusA